MTGWLLARGGTRSRSAEALEERLAFLAAELNSEIRDTFGSVSLNLLSKDLDEGLAILREVLSEPRFQEDKIALRKQQMIQFMQQRNDDSSAIEAREANRLAYGERFFNNRLPTKPSVEAIRREDIVAFHRRWFAPSNFVLAVSGDFDREAMIGRLEALFADWPFSGQTPPPVPTNTVFAAPGVYLVDKDVNQGRVSMLLPGLLRDDPDYFPAMVMNDILGGGGFMSRIVNRVRSDEGLAYSAYTVMPGGVPVQVPYRRPRCGDRAGRDPAHPLRTGQRSRAGTIQARVHRAISAHVCHQGAGGADLCPGRIHRSLRQRSAFLEALPRPDRGGQP